MTPTRQKLIGKNKVEEYVISRLFDEARIYINGKIEWDETYDQAVARLERGE